jgi:hypothetical protein
MQALAAALTISHPLFACSTKEGNPSMAHFSLYLVYGNFYVKVSGELVLRLLNHLVMLSLQNHVWKH